MSTEIMLLTKDNREAFEPCVMPDIWQHMGDNDIFGYGIAEESNAVGAIVGSYDNEDDIINILSIGVSPEYQRRGFASQLLKHLEGVCSVNGFYEIHARYFMSEQERAPLESLLTSCGYSFVEGEFKQVTFTLGSLKGSRGEKQLLKAQAANTMGKLVRYGELAPQLQKWLLGQVSIRWEESSTLSPTRSCISVRDGQVVGAVLISEEPGTLEIVQLHSVAGEEAASMLCLFAAMAEAYATLPADTVVRFHAVDDIAVDLSNKLLGDCETSTIHEQIAYRSVISAVTESPEE